MYPLGQRVTDTRAAAPPTRTAGDVPARAVTVAAESVTELGLVGLVLAGATRATDPAHRPLWTAARGWADLDRPETLRTDHRFPAYGVTKLITSTAVLRLVAEGRVSLDGPANEHLRAVRLADDGRGGVGGGGSVGGGLRDRCRLDHRERLYVTDRTRLGEACQMAWSGSSRTYPPRTTAG